MRTVVVIMTEKEKENDDTVRDLVQERADKGGVVAAVVVNLTAEKPRIVVPVALAEGLAA